MDLNKDAWSPLAGCGHGGEGELLLDRTEEQVS